MTDETVTNCHALKLVNCGCGGEAEIDWVLQPDGVYMTGVYCENCGTKTIPFWSMEKNKAIDYAVTAWNRAMGNGDKTSPVERTAKVVNKEIDYRDDEYEHDRLGGQFQKGKCGICKHRVIEEFDFCPSCGAKLDWSE